MLSEIKGRGVIVYNCTPQDVNIKKIKNMDYKVITVNNSRNLLIFKEADKFNDKRALIELKLAGIYVTSESIINCDVMYETEENYNEKYLM